VSALSEIRGAIAAGAKVIGPGRAILDFSQPQLAVQVNRSWSVTWEAGSKVLILAGFLAWPSQTRSWGVFAAHLTPLGAVEVEVISSPPDQTRGAALAIARDQLAAWRARER